MTLSQSPVEGVGKAVLAEVAESVVLNLEGRDVGYLIVSLLFYIIKNVGQEQAQHTGLGNGLLGKCLNEGGLVGGGVDELVVQDLDLGVLGGQVNDLVGDGLSIGKGRNVLANTGEAELDVLGVGSLQLSLALLTNEDQVEVLALGKKATNRTGHSGVNTTAETLVGGAHDDEGLLLVGLGGGGLGGLEDLVGGLSVLAGVVHAAGGTGELGGGDNLHGVCDLLDVSDGLQTSLDLTESRIGGGGAGASSSSKAESFY